MHSLLAPFKLFEQGTFDTSVVLEQRIGARQWSEGTEDSYRAHGSFCKKRLGKIRKNVQLELLFFRREECFCMLISDNITRAREIVVN